MNRKVSSKHDGRLPQSPKGKAAQMNGHAASAVTVLLSGFTSADTGCRRERPRRHPSGPV